MRTIIPSLFPVLLMMAARLARRAAPDWNAVGQALGKAGAKCRAASIALGLPRGDLHVSLAHRS